MLETSEVEEPALLTNTAEPPVFVDPRLPKEPALPAAPADPADALNAAPVEPPVTMLDDPQIFFVQVEPEESSFAFAQSVNAPVDFEESTVEAAPTVCAPVRPAVVSFDG